MSGDGVGEYHRAHTQLCVDHPRRDEGVPEYAVNERQEERPSNGVERRRFAELIDIPLALGQSPGKLVVLGEIGTWQGLGVHHPADAQHARNEDDRQEVAVCCC